MVAKQINHSKFSLVYVSLNESPLKGILYPLSEDDLLLKNIFSVTELFLLN